MKVVEGAYMYPFIPHAPLEPMNAVAQWQGDKIEIWAPSQTPGGALGVAARTTGLQQTAVRLHLMKAGGGFGRRLTNDYVAEADTDSDKTVSDDEQAAYETKLRQQAEAAAATKAAAAKETAPQDALTAEVRATYGVDEAAEPVLNITA